MNKLRLLLYPIVTIIIAIIIVSIPYVYIDYQDSEIMNQEKQMMIEPINIIKTNNEFGMSLKEKIALLKSEDADIEVIPLETGNIFSLYEARKQCFNELCKITVLEMDIYGPVKEEIFISPKLLIDLKTPSHTMLIWTGTVTIKDITYQITLEEESQKFIDLQIIYETDSNNAKMPQDIELEWNEYIEA